MRPNQKRLSKAELVFETWLKLKSTSVGAKELSYIQRCLESDLGLNATDSPAAIARILADAGVPLRHPEVLNEDLKWRQSVIRDLFDGRELSFISMENALTSIQMLVAGRQTLFMEGNKDELNDLLEHVRGLKRDLERQGSLNPVLNVEVIQWLTIWLQTPEIFSDWLDLRRESPDFVRKFGV